MSDFLSALGEKIAERWLSLLVLPGLLYISIAVAGGHILTQEYWHDFSRLQRRLNEFATTPAAHSPGFIILGVFLILAGAAGVGFVAQTVGTVVERIWLTDVGYPLSQKLASRRTTRWTAAKNAYNEALIAKANAELDPNPAPAAVGEQDLTQLNTSRNRVSLTEPRRPTWIGDRMLSAGRRIHSAYDLDINSAWPRLWLIVPDPVRDQLQNARADFAAAARLSAWGLGYLPIAFWWWPAALIGFSALGTGWHRGRNTITVLAELIEATVDLHGRDLAKSLGIPDTGPLTPETGAVITEMLRKGV
ncbi:hypothetical protein ABZZ47_06005 [Streptomyces sp. NPDC006465]|uniref:hypothetical protein n=1 Tax=Streptomyces sp. NPDC006465 TaxID=3157174 RepID=UPI0033A62642